MSPWPFPDAVRKSLLAAAVGTATLAMPAGAQSRPASPMADVVVTGERAASRCAARGRMDVACLNREVAAAAASARPPVPADPMKELRAPIRAGTFSRAATEQRMGSNFGRAATPYRPGAAFRASPILPVGARP